MPRFASRHTRDTAPSAFAVILAELIARLPGARSAALVDYEGETVDYAGRTDPFEIRIAAAEGKILLSNLSTSNLVQTLGEPRTMVLRGTARSILVHALPERYAVISILGRRAGFLPWRRALSVCERALSEEAGWPLRAEARQWHPVDVERDARELPSCVLPGAADRRFPIDVVGSVRRPGERSYRIHVPSTGADLTLVREPGNRWYTDESITDHQPIITST